MIIVTSGAVGVGKKRLMKQSLLRQSLSDVLFQVEYVKTNFLFLYIVI